MVIFFVEICNLRCFKNQFFGKEVHVSTISVAISYGVAAYIHKLTCSFLLS